MKKNILIICLTILFVSCKKETVYQIETSSCYYNKKDTIEYYYKNNKEAKFELQYNNVPDPKLIGTTYYDTTKKLVELNTGEIISDNVCNYKIL